ncbi:hypothetical protein BH18ACI2_BH18ACI2_13060 [soil metagenome]
MSTATLSEWVVPPLSGRGLNEYETMRVRRTKARVFNGSTNARAPYDADARAPVFVEIETVHLDLR